MPKLIDCFIFYNEIALLKYRLHLLYPIVDHFICVEASTTHTNEPKPSYFTLYKKEFEPYMDKIIHILVEDMPISSNPWDLGFFQRNAIDRGIQTLTLSEEDTIIISDVDEIIDPEKLKILQKRPLKHVLALEQKVYYFNPTILQRTFWPAAKALPYSLYCSEYKRIPNDVRGAKEFKIMYMAGWHFSYFGSVTFIQNKLSTSCHQENNISSINNKEHIEECIKTKSDIFKANNEYMYVPLEENTYLPKDIHLLLQWLEDFKDVV